MMKTQSSYRWKKSATLGALLLVFLVTGFLNYPQLWNQGAAAARGAGLNIPDYWNVPFRLGLDLQGGSHLVYEADLSEIPSGERADALEGARDVIERRVNAFGVAEPLVETARAGDTYRINVELAGITDVSKAIQEIGETPTLEFKIPKALTPEEGKKIQDEQNAVTKLRANEALKRALKKEDFAKLVEEYSEDESKSQEGKTGFIHHFDGNFDLVVKEVEKLRPYKGQLVNRLIETDFGYWIVKVNDIRYTEKEYKASHLLVCYQGASSCTKEWSKEEALAKITALIAQAKAWNFAKLVQENSTEPNAITSLGQIRTTPGDYFVASQMVEPFAKALRAMRAGTITQTPVETQFGYHLIYKQAERVLPEYNLQLIRFKKFEVDLAAEQWEATDVSGKDLKTARVEFDQTSNEPYVAVTFTKEGATKFAALTTWQLQKPIGIFLDGEVISAPTVQSVIEDGNAIINGNFKLDEAKTLARRLNAGALPVPIRLESQSTIGPTLGQSALESSLKAGYLGFALIALFMILYYRLPGLVAVLALVFYTTLNLAIFKLVPVTLTLSGIAGFIITLGMAVDANVLIFERLREELKLGRTLGAAIDEGFKRAWTSIFDSNLTTLFAAVILFFFTSSVIKGFALTLGIGVLASMFTAISVTRVILHAVATTRFAKRPFLYGAGPTTPCSLKS